MRQLKVLAKKRRHLRIRKDVIGTKQIPRMSVFRSLRHIYVQFIDDINGKTLISCSTLSKKYSESLGGKEESNKKNRSNKKSAGILGKIIGEIALEKGIKKAVFDRSGYKYHGVVRELADGARKAGLVF